MSVNTIVSHKGHCCKTGLTTVLTVLLTISTDFAPIILHTLAQQPLAGDDAAAVAQVALPVIDDGELAWGNALHVFLALDDPAAVLNMGEFARHDVGGVTVLEHDVNGALDTLPGIS